METHHRVCHDAPELRESLTISCDINEIGSGMASALSLCMSQGDNLAMNQACAARSTEEPKYFLLWTALWIVALLVLLREIG